MITPIYENPTTDREKFSNLSYSINCLVGDVRNGASISEMYEICKNNGNQDIDAIGRADIMKKAIERLKSEFNNITTDDESEVDNIAAEFSSRYNLSDYTQFAEKFREAIGALDTVDVIVNTINTTFPNNNINDAKQLVAFISELIKQVSNMQSVQNNANAMFTNFNAILAENATLKAQIAAMQNSGK